MMRTRGPQDLRIYSNNVTSLVIGADDVVRRGADVAITLS